MKTLPQGSYLIRPFKAYKNHTYSYTYGGTSNKSFLSIDEGTVPPVDWRWNEYVKTYNSGSGTEKNVLYSSVKNFFYPDISLTGSNIPPQFDRGWDFDTSLNGIYVINISQISFGEQIYPGTFRLRSASQEIADDGYGRLYNTAAPTQYIGNIFYPYGIAILPKSGSTPINSIGLSLLTGSILDISYRSQVTIYEHAVHCTMERGEFNYSSNASLIAFTSSSISGSTTLINEMLTGSLTPYITTIGLYNSNYDLLAVAKFPRPIRRIVELDQTVVIKFDL